MIYFVELKLSLNVLLPIMLVPAAAVVQVGKSTTIWRKSNRAQVLLVLSVVLRNETFPFKSFMFIFLVLMHLICAAVHYNNSGFRLFYLANREIGSLGRMRVRVVFPKVQIVK